MYKVLFIIQSYPSEQSANVLCDEKIMQAMLDTGRFEIHCLSYRYNGQSNEEIVNGIHVHRWNRDKWWDIYTWARHHESDPKSIHIFKLNRIFLRLKQIFFIPIFPFYEPILARQFAKKSIDFVSGKSFDLIVAEYYGLDTLYAGWKTKQKYNNLLFVPIFWDPLSGGIRPKYLPPKYVDLRKKILEKKVVSDSDKVVAMCSHRKHITELWSEDPIFSKFIFLDLPRLSIQHNNFSKKSSSKKINFVFSGSMGERNPYPLFKVISNSAYNNIEFVFFTSKIYHDRIQKYAEETNVKITVNSYIPHDELLSVLQKADVLVSFGTTSNTAVPSKIFEYISLGKPIIATYRTDNDPVIPVLKKYSNALLLNERVFTHSQITEFDKFIKESRTKKVDMNEVAIKFRDNLPETYVDFFIRLLECRTQTEVNIDGK